MKDPNENYVIYGPKVNDQDSDFIKRCIFSGEDFTFISAKDLSDFAVQIKAYDSKSQARQVGRFGPIPTGYTEMFINKRRKVYIWNPTMSRVEAQLEQDKADGKI